MEIERKYLIETENLPPNYRSYPRHEIEQGYLCTSPVVRIRKDNEDYFLTYKSKGLMVREEYNLPLTADAYCHLRSKVDGLIIEKERFVIPLTDSLNIELDIFHGKLEGLLLAEVEFPDVESAEQFKPPLWFGKDVTNSSEYHNSNLSKM